MLYDDDEGTPQRRRIFKNWLASLQMDHLP